MSEPPIAFLSYAHADDGDHRVSRLREALGQECRRYIGRPFTIFQDRQDIQWGEEWRSRISSTVANATFFIPILSPSFLQSNECRKELRTFLDRERHIGRRDLILPILYIPIPEMNNPEHADDLLLAVLVERQYSDWRELRLKGFQSIKVRTELAGLAVRVRTALDKIGNLAMLAAARVNVTTPTLESTQKEATRPISTRWEGTWQSPTSHFSFVMHLNLDADGVVEGYILWRLLSIDPTSFLSNRINDAGNEFVKGRVKADGSGLLFSGYKVDEPFLLATDAYDLSFADPPGHIIRHFIGKTRTNRGDWSGRLSGVMTVENS